MRNYHLQQEEHANSQGTYVVLVEELLGEGGAHSNTALDRGGGEVRLAHLSPGGGLVSIQFHYTTMTIYL